jgi:chemotaxis protein methyltransferase CheR
LNDTEFENLQEAILGSTGIDLTHYKKPQMRRRLTGDVTRTGLNVRAFCKRLAGDRQLGSDLKEFITINVSEFFRNPEQFQYLRSLVLPELLERSARLSIWSAGCSHGGEAYSIAMLLNELAPGVAHTIVGTDLDEVIVERARAGGPYTAEDVRATEKWMLPKYFDRRDGEFWVDDAVRRRVRFSRHDLLRDRFDQGFDLIVCRNVVIYFSDEAKLRLNQKFHSALKPHGWLFIGATETLLADEDLGLTRVRSSLYRKGDAPVAHERAA